MELALEFWAFGRVKSTTVAHFCLKVGLALGFWTSDVRHSRAKSSVLGPDGRHARTKPPWHLQVEGRGFRVFMFLDMSLGLMRRPKRAGELTLKIRPRAQTRATKPGRLGFPRGGAVPPRMGWEPASRRRVRI